MEDHYSTLGVKSSATQNEIKQKYYELAKKHHPDAVLSKDVTEDQDEYFKRITAAYEVLSNQA